MKRFKYPIQGLITIIKKDLNFLLHLITAVIVILAGIFFGISKIEWIVIILVIALVLAFEAINTAVEYVVDLVTDEYKPLAKRAKDTAALSVLIISIAAGTIGLIIFIPYILNNL
ncbi:diacylglycerol kinase [Staphylococcus condimenti]|uniref:Diacylglycerol kinase family protein n=2 Tax=Staphylococcus condimenti TaxID=70255 RepID=A0A143P879_9STAP|nr:MULTISPECIES: diacylglycerol kinase family protein [Staphylococcus]AMY04667.1 diacylglycerol kinase [Staphylococcus condimenti]APR60906.1 diacylglycerol kinase [Staphylococcus condimenti]MDK8644643.1 diacylglycerol kinase family protein [Staphylococcus condimenti]OFO99049.1 diacylglycerol kinase [Staphylococcus sp. HMSC065E08]PNZ60841.1 diacylglycerol kinase [Staphylococcus condimenti]